MTVRLIIELLLIVIGSVILVIGLAQGFRRYFIGLNE
jgi:hypothetical protein